MTRRRSGLRGIWLLNVAMTGAGLLALLAARDQPALLGGSSAFGMPLLAALFCVADMCRVFVTVRRDHHSVSMNDIPLTIGLLMLTPGDLMLARLIGAALAYGVMKRQPALKLMFNLGIVVLEVGVSTLLLHHLVTPSTPMGPQLWLATFAAALPISLLSAVFVLTVVSLSDGASQFRHLPRSLLFSILATLSNVSIGLEVVAIVRHDLPELLLLVLPVAIVTAAYHGYTVQTRRYARLQSLYRSSDLMRNATADEGALVAFVEQLCSVFRAATAEITLFPTDDGRRSCMTIVRRDGVTTTGCADLVALEEAMPFLAENRRSLLLRSSRAEDDPWGFLRSRGIKDAMVTALHGDNRIVGTMLVGNRTTTASTFDAEDLTLFEALATQASITLENGRLEHRLRHQAFHDSLTQLANRELFTDRVAHALTRRGQGSAARAAVLFIDLDDFKMVNDSLGHAAGDTLLAAVAERLRTCLRPEDTPARLGGDEFAVLMEDVGDSGSAVQVAARIVGALAEPFLVHGREIPMHASIGIVLATRGTTADEMLRRADLAMYRAKARGKDCYETYEPSMQNAAAQRLGMKTELERALQRGELVVQYQPIVMLTSGRITGVEALVRWQHPRLGMVPPSQFIPLAEETGLIMGLGRFVLDEACRQARIWQVRHPAHPLLTMSVNLSPRQVQHPGFVADVSEALRSSGLDPQRLTLEITENVMVEDPHAVSEKLRQLKALGVRISIDDFGTGFSSLSALHELPVDELKIAKTFIDRINEGPQEQAFARAIVRLGKTLNLKMVAEGVEREEQRTQLRSLRCEMAQGYHFARPMNVEDVDALLDTACTAAPRTLALQEAS